MRKATVLLAILLPCLLTSVVAEFCTVRAQQDFSFGVGFSIYKTATYVNQPVEITAYATGGTPPYTYQWTTEFIPQEVLESPYFPLDLLFPNSKIIRIEVPGAASPTFNFLESAPGTYNICLSLTDAAGNDAYASTGPFIVVLPIPTSSPSPTPTPPPPSIKLLSPENKTYTTDDLPLNFTLTGTVQWIGYSLDGQANVTIDEKMTLPQLTTGSHSITVYANDTYGNAGTGTSETVNFTVAESEPLQSEFSQTTPVTIVTLSVSAVAVSVGLAVYFKKRQGG